MTTLQSIRGMHDVLPDEMSRWRYVEETYRELVQRYGYREIRTPMLEPLELFVRGIGEDTDIVEKEMYAFQDKGQAWVALRPEGTASTIRACLQHNLVLRDSFAKLYYLGPMFRRERPAKGRYRQFYQAGAELIGEASPLADAELIEMACRFLEELGIRGLRVQLNSLGDADTRPRFRAALIGYFADKLDGLCVDCQRRMNTNPLRVLDCKVDGCRTICAQAPSVLEYLGEEAREHLAALTGALESFGLPFTVVPTMVRGLDYYTRTIFEIQGNSPSLGAQATLVGGGRYDGLIEQLGGRPTPAIGFSFGLERLLMVLDEGRTSQAATVVFVAAVGTGGLERAQRLARELRSRGVPAETAYTEASLRSQLRRADRVRARFVVIAGDEEASRGAVTFRNMEDGTQRELPAASVVDHILEAK